MTAVAEAPTVEAPAKPEDKAITTTNPVRQALVSIDTTENAALLDTAKFNQMYRAANMFARSTLVPQQFRGKVDDCFIACQLAVRLACDPFMLMQSMYVVQGKPGLEAKFAIALVNARGPFTGPIQWKFLGKGKERQCTAYAKHRITGEVCECTVSWAIVEAEGWSKKAGSKWLTMPDQMFQYRSATWLARLYCPEVLMGMAAVDEIEDVTRTIIDVAATSPGSRTDDLTKRLTQGAPAEVVDKDTGGVQQSPETAAKVAAAKAALREAEAKAHVSSSPDAQPPADWQPQSEPGENG
jgi:hypothetical protein